MTVIERLVQGLEAIPASALAPPEGGRIGAVLALLEPLGDDDAAIVYTRRQAHLSSHPGQISFPGGRVDDGETPEQAALREGHEEVALDPSTVAVIGRLPSFYIPPSRFWLQTVLAHWRAPHPLHPAEAEVERILTVRLSTLREQERWRRVPLSASGHTWAWDLSDLDPSAPGGLLLWGATAIVSAVLLGVLDPQWNHGIEPSHLGPEREVRPWEDRPVAPAPTRPPLLGGLPEVPAPRAGVDVRTATAAVATAVRSLSPAAVVVLAGAGRSGDVGRALCDDLGPEGIPVLVVGPGEDPAPHLAPDVLVVDALVGRNLDGPLRATALDAVHALRHHSGTILALDVPTGVHAERGLVGDAVSANLTIVLAGAYPALHQPGLQPFLGQLYTVDPATGRLARIAHDPARATWAE